MPLCETVVIKELMCFQQHQNDSNFVWLEALSLPDIVSPPLEYL